MFDEFWNFTQNFLSFTNKEKEIISSYLTLREIPKQYTLVDLGDVAKEVYFVKKGCLRMFYISEEGNEVTGFVFPENMMVSSFESFLSREPSVQIIESIEDSELFVLSFNAINELYQKVPAMNILVRKILEQRMIHAQKVVAALIMNKPQDRYTAYQNLHPGLENRIPQHILASYMGITPVSLSRIKRRDLKGK